jgi:hypothetical protein
MVFGRTYIESGVASCPLRIISGYRERSPTFQLYSQTALQHFVRYRSNNGQRWVLAPDGMSANDPTATLGPDPCRRPVVCDFSLAARS